MAETNGRRRRRRGDGLWFRSWCGVGAVRAGADDGWCVFAAAHAKGVTLATHLPYAASAPSVRVRACPCGRPGARKTPEYRAVNTRSAAHTYRRGGCNDGDGYDDDDGDYYHGALPRPLPRRVSPYRLPAPRALAAARRRRATRAPYTHRIAHGRSAVVVRTWWW